MINSPQLAHSFEVNPEICDVIQSFMLSEDERITQNLTEQGFPEELAAQVGPLWSVGNLCLTAIEVTRALRLAGFQADTLYNDSVPVNSIPIRTLGILHDTRGHTISAVFDGDAEPTYIDLTWSQFLLDKAMTIDNITSHPELNLVWPERGLIYSRADLPEIADWFAQMSRALQEKVRRGVLMGESDVFTRPADLLSLMFGGGDDDLPFAFETISQTTAQAWEIWDPANYKVLTDGDVIDLQELVIQQKRASAGSLVVIEQ